MPSHRRSSQGSCLAAVRRHHSGLMKHQPSARVAARFLPIAMLAAASLHGAAQTPPPRRLPRRRAMARGASIVAAVDETAKPGEDFDQYVNGGWKRKTEIPADQASTGVGYDVFNRSQAQIRAIIEQAPATSPLGRHVSQLHERSRGRGARRQAAAGGPEARRRARRQGRVRDGSWARPTAASASR